MDKLDEIFQKQAELQERIGNKPYKNQEYINIMTLSLIDEIQEALRETPFKPWKKHQQFNEDNFKKELIDALHFFINLCLASGMDANELHLRYFEKNKINFKRVEDGY